MLGLRAKSSFLEYMFRHADKTNSGYVTFDEFMQIFTTFYSGNCINSLIQVIVLTVFYSGNSINSLACRQLY